MSNHGSFFLQSLKSCSTATTIPHSGSTTVVATNVTTSIVIKVSWKATDQTITSPHYIFFMPRLKKNQRPKQVSIRSKQARNRKKSRPQRAAKISANNPAQSEIKVIIRPPKRRGVLGYPNTPTGLASSSLGLTPVAKAHTDQRRAGEEDQQRIGSDDVPCNSNTLGNYGCGIGEQTSDSDFSTRQNTSLL